MTFARFLDDLDMSLNLHPWSYMSHESTAHGPNLVTHRASSSVWDRRGWDGTRERLTVPRWLVGIGGGALAIEGIRQRSITGLMFAGLGASLAWWALTGEGDLSEARRWLAQRLGGGRGRHEDRVAEASADSFPASDAPSWTPTVGTGVRRETRAH